MRVRGARLHNLRDVDVDLPRDALVVFTGVSGSGKSSLAFGTIFAEAQRRFLESLAPHARRLIAQVAAPDVDDITGLPPALALRQRAPGVSGRSSVGSLTTLSNALRLLYSRTGTYPAGAQRLDSEAFSPNTHAGACPDCHGLGEIHRTTEALMVPDPSLSIRERAIAAWPGAWHGKNLRDILDALGHDIDRPWSSLSQDERDWILFTDAQPVVTVHPVRDATTVQGPYEGTYSSPRRYVLHTIATTRSAALRNRAMQFVQTVPCPACGRGRLRPEALAVTVASRSIAELTAMPLADLADVLGRWEPDCEVAKGLVTELLSRIDTLVVLGLGHLGTDRPTDTLSAGELQRLRLATATRAGLFGVVYVLDEPSAGLHPADTEAVLDVLQRLRQAGNTVFVVEHDMTVAARADWLVDVGPGAGSDGGRVLHSGPVAGLAGVQDSVTRRHLFAAGLPPVRSRRAATGQLPLRSLRRNNLRGLDVDIPLGVFTVVTGRSGAGKTTLLGELSAAVSAGALGTGTRLVEIDQTPIGRTPRSNLATYTGLFDGVRRLFAETDAARRRGFDAGRFSFNRPQGRCDNCAGEGYVSVELLFLPTVYSRCATCAGGRYNPETLEVTYRGATIAEVLDLTVADAGPFFVDVPAVRSGLAALLDVGLGYLRLGQPATELSGGEAQRLKLAAELRRAHRGATVYILDEPTGGLHPADVELLLAHLHRLVDSGNTVVVAEHDIAVIAAADHVVELGPGGGDRGGTLVACGPPERIARCAHSATAPYLRAAVR
ncbi:MAG TPA: excinuclease ABC subunit UvrA [Sporichthyaceae bacterium]|nr:excinuclease ABC subunit UvrA [Sporichthyaceae bacterium]